MISIKLSICILALVYLTNTVVSYDFQDESFNQILLRDIDDLTTLDDTSSYYNNVHVRNRRDEEAVNSGVTDKCRRRRFKGCCGDDIMESIHERDRAIKKECFKKVTGKEHPTPHDPFKCDKVEGFKKNTTCVIECVFEKKDRLDKEGNILIDGFLDGVKQVFGNTDWLMPILEKAVPKCLDEAKKAASEPRDKDTCNPSSIKMVHCLFREVQLNCPADQIKDEKSCNRLRERLQKNDFLGPHQHGHSDDE